MKRLERLTEARDVLSRAIADADAKELPSLIREYRAVLSEIEELSPKEAVGDSVDEIAARRSARRAGAAKGSQGSKRSG